VSTLTPAFWGRQLRSNQRVSYNDLPYREAFALAGALDEWEWLMHRRFSHPSAATRRLWDSYFRSKEV
jgi:hypothetical protein